jgi:peptidoglycan-associated lipoprotein
MQLKDLGIKVLTVVALTAFLGACSKAPVETQSSGAGASESSSDEGPGRVERPEVTEETISGPADGSYDQLVAFSGGDRVHFEFDSHELSTAAQAVLGKQAEWLNKYPNASITVEGHCDERGTREYNIALGARRSNAVKEYLVSMGVSGYRVKSTTMGKEVPFDPRSNEDAWAKNRRAEVSMN